MLRKIIAGVLSVVLLSSNFAMAASEDQQKVSDSVAPIENVELPLWDFTTFREVLLGVIKAPETLENTPIYPCEGVIGCYRTLPHFYGLTDAREGKIKGKTQGTTREWSGKENCRDVCQAPPEPPLCEAGQLNIAALVSRWIDGH